ncbi:MAG: hypothetical protein ACOYNI_11530 [Acidimicrobiia bacterium]
MANDELDDPLDIVREIDEPSTVTHATPLVEHPGEAAAAAIRRG